MQCPRCRENLLIQKAHYDSTETRTVKAGVPEIQIEVCIECAEEAKLIDEAFEGARARAKAIWLKNPIIEIRPSTVENLQHVAMAAMIGFGIVVGLDASED